MAPLDYFARRERRGPAPSTGIIRPIWLLVAIAALVVTTGLGLAATENTSTETSKSDRQISTPVAGPKLIAASAGPGHKRTAGNPSSSKQPTQLQYDRLPGPSKIKLPAAKRDHPQSHTAEALPREPKARSPVTRAAQPVTHPVQPAGYYQPAPAEQAPAATAPAQVQFSQPQFPQSQPQPAEQQPAQPPSTQQQQAQPQLRLPFQLPAMRFEELPPPPPGTVRIPLAGQDLAERVQIKQAGGRLTVVVRDVPLNQVLMMLGEEQDLNIVVADNVIAPVSVALENVELADALDALTHIAGYTWTQHNNIIHVTSAAGATRLPPHLQERRVMLFPLDYVSAADLDMTVQGLLSPVGQSFVTQRNTADNRRTQEVLVVEDTPTYLQRISQFVEQADQQPRQVMIEAHVMAVTLKGDARHGVNFEYLFNPGGHNFRLQAQGFAAPNAPQAFFFNVDGTDLDALVECLQSQSESKTLASPKVLVLNNQEARLQVGKQLGFRVTTTTETSTLESVDFLDVGVVLRVTPRITRDGQVVMYVKPEVSSGLVNPDTGLPEEETTEVETNVLLPDGRGMVIGGLIQEKDSDSQAKVAWLGDIWMVGKLFQRKTVSRERVEIIITLLPRIVPPEIPCDSPHDLEMQHATAPVVQWPLDRAHRPWEPLLRDAWTNPLTCYDVPWLCNRCGRNSCRCGGAVAADSGYGYYGLPAYDGLSTPQYDGLPRPSHQPYETVPHSGSRSQPQLLLPAGAGATATASDNRDLAKNAAWTGHHGDRKTNRSMSSTVKRWITPR
jgi:hypothetical protein